MRIAWAVAAMVLIACTAPARAALVVSAGDHPLLADTANQTIQISVTGGDEVQGLNLFVATGDGGALLGGVDGTAPVITAVDITGASTVFGANNTGQSAPDQFPQFWSAYTTTNSGTVAAQGILAVLTIDTTGFHFDAGQPANNVFALTLNFDDSLGIDTDFFDVPAQVNNGTLQIVPEPSAMGLVVLLGLLCMRRRGRR